MSNGPIEPAAEMRMLATTLRQYFLALVQEGFTEQQALIIVGYALTAGGQS